MSTEHATPRTRLSVTTEQNGDGATRLVALGELDMSTIHLLTDSLGAALDSNADAVVVDLAGVSYLDSTGVGALVQARNRAKALGGTLVVANPRPGGRQILQITGVLTALTEPTGGGHRGDPAAPPAPAGPRP